MATYTDITYHLVFGTKNRVRVLDKPRRDDLYRFIWGLLKKRNCHLYRIGGVEDHLHVLTSLHASLALADLIKEIKTSTSTWIKGEGVFPGFKYWQEGYGGFTTDAESRLRQHAAIATRAVVKAQRRTFGESPAHRARPGGSQP